jgi:hypothetical protein
MSKCSPGNLLNLTSRQQVEKTGSLIDDPKTSSFVLIDGEDGSAGKAFYGKQAVILKVANAAIGRDPDSPSIIFKERPQPAIRYATTDDLVNPVVVSS